MPEQQPLELKGRAADPVIEECRAFPERIAADGRRFTFEHHVGYLAVRYHDADGVPGKLTPVSFNSLKNSRRAE